MMEKNLDNIRHSCAHLLAAAVIELWPDTKRTIGPAIENGFYYDFEFAKPISENDLPKIEKKMAEILKTWDKFEGREVTAAEAKKIFADNPYKLELIEDIPQSQEPITIYRSGDFEDLCRGGHSQNPQKDIGAIKLLSLAGAYWRGSEKNKMLTRIYGTCFPTQKELDNYLEMLEEAKKRDHRKDKFGDELFLVESQETEDKLVLKPMNCPHHQQIYASRQRSYRDLPIKYLETTTIYRDEKAGELNGLSRVRSATQDDSHTFCRPDQIKEVYT
ncbi:threonine--tRNA ligase, partial [Candidatus Curtissbacteria bacterium]|nr:threonine--tRNA ligase [Candidatus Curtissbacteria bacterium]